MTTLPIDTPGVASDSHSESATPKDSKPLPDVRLKGKQCEQTKGDERCNLYADHTTPHDYLSERKYGVSGLKPSDQDADTKDTLSRPPTPDSLDDLALAAQFTTTVSAVQGIRLHYRQRVLAIDTVSYESGFGLYHESFEAVPVEALLGIFGEADDGQP